MKYANNKIMVKKQLTNESTVAMNPTHWVPRHSTCCCSKICRNRQNNEITQTQKWILEKVWWRNQLTTMSTVAMNLIRWVSRLSTCCCTNTCCKQKNNEIKINHNKKRVVWKSTYKYCNCCNEPNSLGTTPLNMLSFNHLLHQTNNEIAQKQK